MPNNFSSEERDHSACGVALVANIPSGKILQSSHKLVQDGLKRVQHFKYRSGVNNVTGESDGAGIRFYGLNPRFFRKKFLEQNAYTLNSELQLKLKAELEALKEGEFAVGQYFIHHGDPNDFTGSIGTCETRLFIASELKKQGLRVVAWRNLGTSESVDNDALSKAALKKAPAIWQAIIV